MNKVFLLVGIFLASISMGCGKQDAAPKMSVEKIIGCWRTLYITDTGVEEPTVVVWGHWYIGDFELKNDGELNLKTNNYGQWEFDEVNSKLMIFDEKKTNLLETFDVSFDDNGYLIFENEHQRLLHKQI